MEHDGREEVEEDEEDDDEDEDEDHQCRLAACLCTQLFPQIHSQRPSSHMSVHESEQTPNMKSEKDACIAHGHQNHNKECRHVIRYTIPDPDDKGHVSSGTCEARGGGGAWGEGGGQGPDPVCYASTTAFQKCNYMENPPPRTA
ncbi:hypothetical protein PG997_012722 [Apiospora hydei]|uniref:Uncharacterized protein n=1 Tax=Apiospora hydei TaxID=1337664 RepID=A0ABR1V6V9_9PEZI